MASPAKNRILKPFLKFLLKEVAYAENSFLAALTTFCIPLGWLGSGKRGESAAKGTNAVAK